MAEDRHWTFHILTLTNFVHSMYYVWHIVQTETIETDYYVFVSFIQPPDIETPGQKRLKLEAEDTDCPEFKAETHGGNDSPIDKRFQQLVCGNSGAAAPVFNNCVFNF